MFGGKAGISMSDLFKFPLSIQGDAGTIRIEDADGKVIVVEMQWETALGHHDFQMKRAGAIVESLTKCFYDT